MKITAEFDMNDPGDVMDHYRLTKSVDMALALVKLQYIRNKWKYTNEEPTAGDVFKSINDIFSEYDIDLNKIIE